MQNMKMHYVVLAMERLLLIVVAPAKVFVPLPERMS